MLFTRIKCLSYFILVEFIKTIEFRINSSVLLSSQFFFTTTKINNTIKDTLPVTPN